MSICQLPATLAMNYNKLKDPSMTVQYVVINSQGKSEPQVNVEVKLDKADAMFYEPPDRFRGGEDDYDLVVMGHPAQVDY